MKRRALLLAAGCLLLAACTGFAAVSDHAPIAKIAPPQKTAFVPELVARGAELAGYLRDHYTIRPAWTGLPDEIAKARKSGGAT